MSERHDEHEVRAFSPRVWLGFAEFFRPYAALMAIGGSMMLLCSAIDVLIPIYQRYIIDIFIVPGTLDGLGAAAAAGVAVVVLQMAATMAFTRLSFRVEMRFSRDIKRRCFDHLQTLSLSYYSSTPVGYIIARVMSDTDKIGLLVAWGLVDFLWAISYVAFALISMLVLDLRLGSCLAGLVPLMAAAAWWFQGRIIRRTREARAANSMITAAFNEGVAGARTTKTLVSEELCEVSFGGLTAEMYRASVSAASLSAAFVPVMLMICAAASAMILSLGGQDAASGSLDLGTLSALLSYSIGVFQPIQHISRFISEVTSTQVNIERVSALLDTAPDITDAPEVERVYGTVFEPKPENWEPIRGDVEFDDVSFRYPDGGEMVLEHFNLKVPAGSCVAIVGETGAGKSTIVNLVCRFYEPASGRVLIDGRDSRERGQIWLRSNIGCVLQSPHLFSGTIRDNIRFSRPGATDDEIMAAARLVSADRVIERAPGGLDAETGEGGDLLSTGEKQLLSFARAVLADPRIFVLDEATSSVDSETEAAIQGAIANVLRGRTSFVIAHRLSTVRSADMILVVSGGRIVERGTHDELLKKNGHYSRFCSLQYERELLV